MLEEILTKIGFDWKLAISHFVNLMILFGIIGYFVLPKLKATIEERTKKIKDGIAKSEEAEKVLLDAEVSSSNIIQNARAEQNSILSEAENKKKEIIKNGEVEADKIKVLANQKFEVASENGYKDGAKTLEAKLPDILKSLSLKAFDGKITSELNNEFIQKILSAK
jgi:F0F1-type ATP synthase membrane subunit b/b'